MTEAKPQKLPKPKPRTRQINPKPKTNKYAPKAKVGAPNISPPSNGVSRVGLGKLKVIEQNPPQYDA